MIGEAIGEFHRVRRRCAHAQVERSQTSDQEERFERMQDHSVRLTSCPRAHEKGVVAREAERAR